MLKVKSQHNSPANSLRFRNVKIVAISTLLAWSSCFASEPPGNWWDEAPVVVDQKAEAGSNFFDQFDAEILGQCQRLHKSAYRFSDEEHCKRWAWRNAGRLELCILNAVSRSSGEDAFIMQRRICRRDFRAVNSAYWPDWPINLQHLLMRLRGIKDRDTCEVSYARGVSSRVEIYAVTKSCEKLYG